MEITTTLSKSPFLNYTAHTKDEDLALLYLRRDLQIPVILSKEDKNNEGYSEGKVTNTRFGSFPHSTLLGAQWGSQIRASTVDTGSRGRRGKNDKKRKREDVDVAPLGEEVVKAPVVADTGFVHLVPPTPENWTVSLPHRTQVVYTHDSSYILNRLRVRPGTIIIEAGAGSGSFSHAACRAVYGYGGKVLSFEFHQQRYEKLVAELESHKLEDIIELRHRDVCQDGFGGSLHQASAVFLDLPAPWLALKHLTRNGPLHPHKAVRICTFSPCIEQVQRTVSEMRDLGWIEIEMVEIAAKRIDVRRERFGPPEEGKGANSSAASVDEALARLTEIQKRFIQAGDDESISKGEQVTQNQEAQSDRKLHMEGTITHRSEPELRTHTSYLVFALLPLEWSEEDEERAQQQIPQEAKATKSKKQLKREAKSRRENAEEEAKI